ncbi:MAG: phospho-N-acetylmuramoyl-pentapeptide-transferase [Puniceicoccales bacterium]|jgi:phospho-N-acetylmuramoyl-pentapeptide-transferase|nr:phospho-N-acetylmuramoyl-pentapeptide-transferase [Puniceicoccales bacterium]
MLYFLKDLETFWGPFRLFEYQTFRAMMAGTTALVGGFLVAPWLLRKLDNLRQPEREAALMGEDIVKKGVQVPTMGGFLVLLPAMFAVFLWVRFNVQVAAVIIVYLGMSAVGFVDDYLKIRKNDSAGLSEWAKMAGLVAAALPAVVLLLATPGAQAATIEIWVPFLKVAALSADALPLWLGAAVAVVFFCVVTTGASNAVNFTDGLDGLAIGCVIASMLTFGLVAYLSGHAVFSNYLNISHVNGAGELAVLLGAVIGGAMVFLWYNAEPAQVYMGDLGALGLGGLIGAVAFVTNHPFLLVIVGGVFVVEAMSVIIQRVYYKHTKRRGEGRRIFKMTPIHHHFQKEGWANSKIVVRFWMLALLCGIVGLATLKLR